MRSSRPRQVEGFSVSALDDELVLYEPLSRRIAYCNPTASMVWRLCDGQRTVQQIIDLLTAAYPKSADDVPTDVEAIIARLTAEGLITVDPESA